MPQTVSTEYLTQLVAIIKQQQQTGLLRIEQIGQGTNEQGEIYFEDGRMFYATVGNEHGRPALQHISEWAHVIYAFQPLNKPLRRSGPLVKEGTQPRERDARELPSRASVSQGRSAVSGLHPRLTKPVHVETSAYVAAPARPLRETQQLEASQIMPLQASSVPPASLSQSSVLRMGALGIYASEMGMSQHGLLQQPAEREHLESWPAHEPLPGRLAIFQTRVRITSPQDMQKLERRARLVFVLLDGRRTVQHIAYLLHQTEEEVGQIVLKLMKMNLIEYVEG